MRRTGCLWRELASRDIQASDGGAAQNWWKVARVARKLDSGENRIATRCLDHVLGRVTAEMTVLDASGRAHRRAGPVPHGQEGPPRPAVEPRPGNAPQVLLEACDGAGIANLDALDTPWVTPRWPPDDVVVAAHCHLHDHGPARFVRKMETSACGAAIWRSGSRHDGIIGELSERINRRWHDSPNFIVGYNLLLSQVFTPMS